MSTDPRNAKDLDEAARNEDGTYNGLRALSWLSRVLTRGEGVPLDEVEQMAVDAKAKAQGGKQ
ncbi:hypothetical protein V2J83_11860 [Pseudomonas alliivorans]|nr:hypothetical protein [Pseudomonas alliivorans]